MFNILQSAYAALAVGQDSLTHTQLSGGLLHIALVLMSEGYVDYAHWGLPEDVEETQLAQAAASKHHKR